MNIFNPIFQNEAFLILNFLLLSNLILIPYLIRTIRNLLFQIYLWQLKEYRWDRMRAHLSTAQGKKVIFGYLTILKWLVLLAVILIYQDIFFILIDNRLLSYIAALILLYIPPLIFYFEALSNIFELFTRGWHKPKITIKAALIIILSLIIWIFALLIIYNLIVRLDEDLLFISLLLADKTIPLIVGLVVLLHKIPTLIYKKWLVSKAINKINSLDNLTVIGITGSYGKTSTKEFLAQILSVKFKVLKTEGSTNTEIGVAETILNKLNKSHEIFIVEMGAYKKGEIKAICELVGPQIGIITGINQQHLSLFGTIEETMKTKYELISSLKRGGKAFFNIGNDFVAKMQGWAMKKRPDLSIFNYQYDYDQDRKVISAGQVRVHQQKIFFNIHFQKKTISCETKLIGLQNIENILAATAISFQFGLSSEEMQKAIRSLEAPERTMKTVGKKDKLSLIDDTFNANPDGVYAAIEYMKLTKGKKILVLTPLIELGNKAEEIHEKIGHKVAKGIDFIILTNNNYLASFLKDFDKSEPKISEVIIARGSEAVDILNRLSVNKGTVVFEGKEAGKILEKLILDDKNV